MVYFLEHIFISIKLCKTKDQKVQAICHLCSVVPFLLEGFNFKHVHATFALPNYAIPKIRDSYQKHPMAIQSLYSSVSLWTRQTFFKPNAKKLSPASVLVHRIHWQSDSLLLFEGSWQDAFDLGVSLWSSSSRHRTKHATVFRAWYMQTLKWNVSICGIHPW